MTVKIETKHMEVTPDRIRISTTTVTVKAPAPPDGKAALQAGPTTRVRGHSFTSSQTSYMRNH